MAKNKLDTTQPLADILRKYPWFTVKRSKLYVYGKYRTEYTQTQMRNRHYDVSKDFFFQFSIGKEETLGYATMDNVIKIEFDSDELHPSDDVHADRYASISITYEKTTSPDDWDACPSERVLTLYNRQAFSFLNELEDEHFFGNREFTSEITTQLDSVRESLRKYWLKYIYEHPLQEIIPDGWMPVHPLIFLGYRDIAPLDLQMKQFREICFAHGLYPSEQYIDISSKAAFDRGLYDVVNHGYAPRIILIPYQPEKESQVELDEIYHLMNLYVLKCKDEDGNNIEVPIVHEWFPLTEEEEE